MAENSEPSGNERREFVRIDDTIGLEATLVDPEEKKNVRARELLIPAPLENILFENYETEDSKTLRYLAAINSKLDLLIKHLVFDDSSPEKFDSQKVNLSACGINFKMSGKPAKGDLVEIKMLLPGSPPVSLCTYAEILRADGPEENGQYAVGAEFVAMGEDIREEIVRYIFGRQRELLRAKREQR